MNEWFINLVSANFLLHDYRDMIRTGSGFEFPILDCNDLLLEKIPQRESKIQVHRDMECVFTVIISYCLGESQIQFHKDLECILDCNYLFLRAPIGRVEYSTTKLWNEFYMYYNHLLLKAPQGRG